MFRAVRIDKSETGQTARLVDFDENELMDGDVTVRVEWSTVNYKDGLAVSGKAPVVRRFPMIPGIDFVGMVENSTHPEWKPGDRVILNGWGAGESHLGAVPPDGWQPQGRKQCIEVAHQPAELIRRPREPGEELREADPGDAREHGLDGCPGPVRGGRRRRQPDLRRPARRPGALERHVRGG